MSIEIVLVPLAFAAVAAVKAAKTETKLPPSAQGRTAPRQESAQIVSRLTNGPLLVRALQDLGGSITRDASNHVVAAFPWGDLSMTRPSSGIWTAHFPPHVIREEAHQVVQQVDEAYGLLVQQEVLAKLRERAPQAGMTVESETVADDRTVTLVLNVGG